MKSFCFPGSLILGWLHLTCFFLGGKVMFPLPFGSQAFPGTGGRLALVPQADIVPKRSVQPLGWASLTFGVVEGRERLLIEPPVLEAEEPGSRLLLLTIVQGGRQKDEQGAQHSLP